MNSTIILILLALVKVALSINPIVELPSGKIQGRKDITFANKTYYAFQKIPYAAPPLGALRFKAPQPVQPWKGILNATVLDVICYQLETDLHAESENCLVLNVYTPKLPDGVNNISLPVLFYIHSGAYWEGSSIGLYPDLFVNNDVIFVTINYRLGAFGFLSTQDDIILGNNGLKDQQFALQWTYNNIHLFGGNPKKITINGVSAGSASATFQLVNQNSAGLIAGAILESSVFISPGSIQRNARKIAFDIGKFLNATLTNQDNSEELLNFLQSVDARDLDAASDQYRMKIQTPWYFNARQDTLFAPVIEVKHPDAFITKKMYGMLKAGNLIRVPSIVFITSEEGLLFSRNADVLQTVLEAWDNNLDLIVPDNMNITDPTKHAEMAVAIRDIYTNGEPFGTNLGAAVRYSSDNAYTRSIVKFAELYSNYAKVYFCQFSYDGQLGGVSVHYDGAESVEHAAETKYMFCSGENCSFSGYPEKDITASNRIVRLWTDFIKFGNPTPEASELLQNIIWPHISLEEGRFQYLDFNLNLEIKNNPKAESLSKWNALYNSLNFNDFDTY